MKRFLSMPVAASLALLTACQIAPDLNAPSGRSSLKVAGGGLPAQCVKDYFGNCNPAPNEPGPPTAKPPPKASQTPVAPCEKDFWGSCVQTTAALVLPSIAPPPPPVAQPPPKGAKTPAAPCEKDFWGNCVQATAALVLPSIAPPPPPAAQPPPKGAKTPAAPCEKDFWGNCTQPTPALLPPSIFAPSPPASPPAKAPGNPAAPCEKDFWGNCTQVIPGMLAPLPKPPPKATEGPDAQCVKDFWGNCTPVARNRHPYRWRYVRPGHRSPEPSGGRVEQAGPSTVCHPKRRVIGDEQPSTEKAQLAAEQAWMGSVRYDYGERYQNLEMAKDLRYTCAPSSPSTGLKRGMFRCATEAIPCRGSGN